MKILYICICGIFYFILISLFVRISSKKEKVHSKGKLEKLQKISFEWEKSLPLDRDRRTNFLTMMETGFGNPAHTQEQAHTKPYPGSMQVLQTYKTLETEAQININNLWTLCCQHCSSYISSLATSHPYDQRMRAR